MNTIVIINQKGGVGKTTTSLALAAGLSHKGYKVVGIDTDPQCNFTLSAGVDPLQVEQSLYDVFKKSCGVKDVIRKSPVGYDVIPGGLMLAGADMEFTQTGREYMLSEALEAISGGFDYAVIDCPPTLGILSVNALTAARWVIIPMAADVYSIQGLSQLNGLIESTRRYCNHDLRIMGLLLTKYHERQNVSKTVNDMIQSAADQLHTKVFDTKIRESVAIREAALMQYDFLTEAPKANATIDYNGFIDEVISYGN